VSQGDDLGDPIAYLALDTGTPLYSSDGVQIGTVAHVLAAEDEDIFDGIVVAEGIGHRFVDSEQIDRIYERGVLLNIDAAACAGLPKPSANPAVLKDDPALSSGDVRHSKLMRAWDRISGNY
jgi:hypothetical protein